MSFMPAIASLATAEEKLRQLPMAAWVYGVIAFACFVVLLGVLWSFRNTAAKYDKPDRGAHH
jgi:NADH:ubiquinone oxidoreductase subunit 6 (subunit J)